MKNKYLKHFLILTGIMAIITLTFPFVIIYGLFAFIIPGIILAISPTVFIYTLIITLIADCFPSKSTGKRWLLAISIALSIGATISYLANLQTYNEIEQLTQGDIEITSPIKLADNIALISSKNYNDSNDGDVILCEAVCQRLLFNKAVKNVLVYKIDGFSYETNREDFVTSYSIEKRQTCPKAEIPEIFTTWPKEPNDTPGNFTNTYDPIRPRIASGECLIKKSMPISDADIIVSNERLSQAWNFKYTDPLSLSISAVGAQRKTVYRKDNGKLKKLYQKTEIKAQPIAYPLMIGLNSGSGLNIKAGFIRTHINQNIFENIEINETKRIFGSAVNSPTESGLNNRELLKKAILDNSSKKTASHDLFENYLRDLDNDKSKISDEDIDLIILALGDKRITDFFHLSFALNEMKDPPGKLVTALANRILLTPDLDSIWSISSVIRSLPEEATKPITSQLEKISTIPEIRENAWSALTRLGDHSPKALKIYKEILTEWDRSVEDNPYLMEDSIVGALIGLCRMGEKAKPAKLQLQDLSARYHGSVRSLANEAVDHITIPDLPKAACGKDWN